MKDILEGRKYIMDTLFQSLMDKKLNEAFQIIQQTVERLKLDNQMLCEENNRLKDDAYKDNELVKMKTELDNLKKAYNGGFSISEEEQKQIYEWQKKHEAEVHNCYIFDDRFRRGGAIGGGYTYEFIPISIGMIGKIKCGCGAEFVFHELE